MTHDLKSDEDAGDVVVHVGTPKRRKALLPPPSRFGIADFPEASAARERRERNVSFLLVAAAIASVVIGVLALTSCAEEKGVA